MLRVFCLYFWPVTVIRPAVRQRSFFLRVELLLVEDTRNAGQHIYDDCVELATDDFAHLVTVDYLLKSAVDINLYASVIDRALFF